MMTDAASRSAQHDGPVAIVCGGGKFPFVVADAVLKHGRGVVLFAVQGWTDAGAIVRYPHHWAGLARFGRFCRIARAAGCRDVVFIGTMLRPSLWELRPDLTALRYMPRVAWLLRGGDNHLLSGIAAIFEENGFRLVGAHEVAPEILVPEGTLGRRSPSEQDRADIARGLAVIRAMGPFDIGQAAVVDNNYVLAVEAAEGTDAMLARVAAMRREGRIRHSGRSGVLVKAPKPRQDRRIDLPSLGVRTVRAITEAGLAGIAVEAEGAITADLEELVMAADAAGIFVVGVPIAAQRARP